MCRCAEELEEESYLLAGKQCLQEICDTGGCQLLLWHCHSVAVGATRMQHYDVQCSDDWIPILLVKLCWKMVSD